MLSRKTPFGWHFGSDDPASMELDFERSAGKFEAKTAVADGVWVHAAMVYRLGLSVHAYVDGKLTRTIPGAPSETGVADDAQTWIGCRNPGTGNFAGVIDELRVYSRALDDQDVADIVAAAP